MNYCPYCGSALRPDYTICPNCGRSLRENSSSSTSDRGDTSRPSYDASERRSSSFEPDGPMPESYVTHAIVLGVVSLLVCWLIVPFAIATFLKGQDVERLWREGNVAGAQGASLEARKWFRRGLWALGLWGLFILLFLVVYFVGGLVTASHFIGRYW